VTGVSALLVTFPLGVSAESVTFDEVSAAAGAVDVETSTLDGAGGEHPTVRAMATRAAAKDGTTILTVKNLHREEVAWIAPV
jgi:hypothetical protein